MNVTGEQSTERKIADFVSQQPIREALDYLIDSLPEGAVIYLVGGAIRNLIIEVFHGRSPPIDDIDLFVSVVSDDFHLAEILPDDRFIITDIGGVRWRPARSTYDIDICLLQDFIIIKKYHLAPVLQNLIGAIDFTMNTVVYDICNQKLYERNALADIQKRLLAFNTRKLYTKTAIAYRTLLLRYKTGFALSQDVFYFVKQLIDLDTLMAVKQILSTRFGKDRMHVILDDYDRICSFCSFDDYSRHAPEALAGDI